MEKWDAYDSNDLRKIETKILMSMNKNGGRISYDYFCKCVCS